jgi:RimJ/RimL family protein N-acetyltransferase
MDKVIEIGYAIATDFQNKGYASEIIIPFSNWEKNKLKINKIYGVVKKQNISSWKVLGKMVLKL